MKKIFILKHIANEGAGTLEEFLKKVGAEFEVVELYGGGQLPEVEEVSELVVMGGPMNVYEENSYPFLKEETTFIARALEQGVPTLGICLGSQLIAKALGAKVYKANVKEMGWDEIRLSDEAKRDAVFSEMDFPLTRVLQWHEDTFDLPEEAVLLASSKRVPHQAFRYKNSYGLQFHIEVNRGMLEDWFGRMPEARNILAEFDRYEPKLADLCDRVYAKFFNKIKILWAEDDASIQKVVAQRLRSQGYLVSIASDGLEALDKIQESRPDIIILDAMMPKMAGGEVAAHLQKDPQFAQIPVIFLTGAITETEVNLIPLEIHCPDPMSKRLARHMILTKPINSQQLISAIETLVQQSRNVKKS